MKRTLFFVAALAVSACYPQYQGYPYYPSASGGGGGGFVGADGGPFGGGFGGGDSFCSSGFDFSPAVTSVTPPAISGGSMTALSDGTLVIGDIDRDVLWVVKGHGELIRRIALSPGAEPGRVVEGAAGTAYVVLRKQNAIAQLDVASGTLSTFATCSMPRALVYRAAQHELLVGCADGSIARHVGATHTEFAVDSKISDLRDLVEEGDHLIATSFRSAKVFSIDSASGVTTSLTHTGVATDGVARVAWRAIGTPNGTLVSYQTERATKLPLIGSTCGAYGSPTPSLPSLVVSTVGRVQGKNVQALTMRPNGVLPVDIAANAAGDFVIAAAATNGVEVSWPFDYAGAWADAGIDVSDGGFSLPDGGDNRVFLTGQPVAVVSRGDEFVVFEREPAGLAFITKKSNTAVEVGLAGASVESTGHRIFHQATGANIACASCHPEAGDDEHVWQFAEGARRTPTLRGGLSSTAPFHWNGDLPTMPALISDVMVRRMSGSQQSDERSSALLAWIDSQHALPAPPVNQTSALRGEALFNSAQTQCASCHFGPQGTNNTSVSVGTSGAFQVPRLVELGWRTQWFHDGRIATAADRFGPAGGGDLHGHTSQLTAQDKADLVEYLKTR